jgi:hypothetical protein
MRNLLLILLLLNGIESNAQADGPSVGTVLRSLSGKDLMTGKLVDIQFKESPGYTVLHFWHTKSDSSINDFPAIVSMEKEYHDKITVYGFPYEYKQDVARAKEYITRYQLSWAQLLQYKQSNPQGANVLDVLKVDLFPTYMLLDRQGMIIVRSGSLNDVEALLKSVK